jgi:hypothetical protein
VPTSHATATDLAVPPGVIDDRTRLILVDELAAAGAAT